MVFDPLAISNTVPSRLRRLGCAVQVALAVQYQAVGPLPVRAVERRRVVRASNWRFSSSMTMGLIPLLRLSLVRVACPNFHDFRLSHDGR